MAPHDFTTAESLAGDRARSLGFVVGICLCGILALVFIRDSAAGPEAPTVFLPGTLNPNIAPAASLMRLPRVGLTRAQAIVAFRGRFREKTGQGAPFRRPGDLQQIRGIGPGTVEDMAEWLRFDQPGGRAENRPSSH